ncbi:MAG: YdcF family protein [Terriglobales bacterium]
MSEAAPKRLSRRQFALWVWVLAVAASIAWLAWICVGIELAASQQDTRPADAIVVFGAAEYSGRPSPVYRARLDHAFDLFQRKVAPVVITTGGAAADPTYSEGGVGHDYLMSRGIADSSLIAETQASDTAQSAERVAVIMRANRMHSCVAVSDAYHVFRIRKLLEHQGIQVHIAPRPDSRPHSGWARTEAVLREAVSYALWRLHITA